MDTDIRLGTESDHNNVYTQQNLLSPGRFDVQKDNVLMFIYLFWKALLRPKFGLTTCAGACRNDVAELCKKLPGVK